MSSETFSQFVMSIDDLYNMAVRNGFYMPNHRPLLQAQVHHALQGVDAGHPLYLLGVEDPFLPFSVGLQD